MNDGDKTYLLKELTRTIDESDSTAAFCLCQRWILKDALAILKEQEDLGAELTNAVELIHKKNERIKKLLKEQEAVEPEKDIARNRRCPKCFTILKGKFCHECGQAVKWE